MNSYVTLVTNDDYVLGARALAQFVKDLQAEVVARTVPAAVEKAAP